VVQHAGETLALALAFAPRGHVAHEAQQRARLPRIVQRQRGDHFDGDLAAVRPQQVELAHHAQARAVAGGEAAQALRQAGDQRRQRTIAALLQLRADVIHRIAEHVVDAGADIGRQARGAIEHEGQVATEFGDRTERFGRGKVRLVHPGRGNGGHETFRKLCSR